MDLEREEDRTPPLARVKGVGRQQKMITVVRPGVAVLSLYKPRNEQFILPTVGHRNMLHIVIGDFNTHSTSSWECNVTDDNGLSHAISH